MAGLDRFVEILRLFDDRKSTWTIAEISDALSVPASTIYRTVRDLTGHAFLEPAAESYYRLGAAFIEFDRRVRVSDPLIRTGLAFLDDLAETAGVPCAVVMARLYGDRVICVAQTEAPGVPTSYERGRPMPLSRGATSKVILAQMPPRHLKKLLARANGELESDAAGDLRAELQAIRKRGFSITRGEVDDGLAGIAVPVTCPALAITASMSLILRGNDMGDALERRLVMLLVASANLLQERILRGFPVKQGP